jgi:hypothetical protein
MTLTLLSLLAAAGMVGGYALGFYRGKAIALRTFLTPAERQRAGDHAGEATMVPELDAKPVRVCTSCGHQVPCPTRRLLEAGR